MTVTKTLDAQIPELLRQLENALRSGYSLLQAFEIAARDMDDPVRGDISLFLEDVRADVPLAAALDRWLERSPGADLDWVIATLHVQFETGGNLADKLNLIGQIMAKRRA